MKVFSTIQSTWAHSGRLWRQGSLGIVAIALITLVAALRSPAHAYEVQITPTSPQLGDTLAVLVQPARTGPSPVVTVKGQSYPTYALPGNRFRALVPTSPLDQPGRLAIQVSGQEETRNLAVDLRNRSFPVQRITLSPSRAGLEGTDYEFRRMDELKALRTPTKFWNGPMSRPNRGRVSSEYGIRRYYNGEFAQDYYHRGVDYADGTGSPILAPAAGRVALVGRVQDGFTLNGNTIGIDHGQGVASVMIHLSRIDVREGDFVQPGQQIGAMGDTGFATGPNLHWGLYVNGVSVDPVPWRNSGIE
ncbi:M23 family metallopeptidase [Pseudanabaena sp. FACHB-2040]|uniref:M23 family metallopeptidase n=1 Tax=Pseudanabaena sp. FACHB-2040 TaxID=2692859 RepID=UPI0016833658|nr:M23 family metallopeptidase [Pseudanabaena sp. FACHB-2040]MBD2257311.1 M23 family metallopeptidase [Pseudanabaena sp. FACHB-2040]